MQQLGIEFDDHNGKNAIPIMHYTVDGKLYGGGKQLDECISRLCLEAQSNNQ
jgi:hypothetical protein